MDIVRSVGRPQSVTPFSFLLFLYFFRAFYQSHRNCPIMDSNQRGVHHILLFFFFEGYAKVVLCSKGTGDKSNNIKKVATNKQTKKSSENYSTILIHWRED